MDELNSIISVVASHTHVLPNMIIKGKSPLARHSRRIVCHIIQEGLPHLFTPFSKLTGCKRTDVYKHAEYVSDTIIHNAGERVLMNAIRRDLGLPPFKIRQSKVERIYISTTKRMFGFDYTEQEEERYQAAVNGAIEFFKTYGKGKQPTFVEQKY